MMLILHGKNVLFSFNIPFTLYRQTEETKISSAIAEFDLRMINQTKQFNKKKAIPATL